MSHHEPAMESEEPLVDKGLKDRKLSSNGNGNSSSNSRGNANNHISNGMTNGRSRHGSGDMGQQHLKNDYNRQIRKLQLTLYVFGGIVITGFIILIIVCGLLFAKLHHDITHHTHKPTLSAQMAAILEEGVCVSCEDFRLEASAEDDVELNKYIDESSGKGKAARCCANTSHELLGMLKLFIERRFRLELAKGTVPGTHPRVSAATTAVGTVKPAAHLMMAQQDLSATKNIVGRHQTIKRWLYEGDMAFLEGGAKYDGGRIVVPMDGYYFVYCHISFTDYNSVLNSGGGYNGSPNLSIYMFRYNLLYDNGGEELMARNSITKFVSSNRGVSEYVISMGAVYHLRRQDHILIKVSNLTLVDSSPKSSNFGFFMI